MPFQPLTFPGWREAGNLIRDDGTLVILADLPGIDPDKDVGLTVSGGMLRLEAERREEEEDGILEIRIPEPEREPARK